MPDPFGLDTSVVLRLLIGEPDDQAKKASEFVEAQALGGRPCLLCDLVISEAYFALQHHYRVPKHEALSYLLKLVESPLIRANGCAPRALAETLAGSSKPGFVDRLISLQYQPGPMATFEKPAGRLTGAKVL